MLGSTEIFSSLQLVAIKNQDGMLVKLASNIISGIAEMHKSSSSSHSILLFEDSHRALQKKHESNGNKMEAPFY